MLQHHSFFGPPVDRYILEIEWVCFSDQNQTSSPKVTSGPEPGLSFRCANPPTLQQTLIFCDDISMRFGSTKSWMQFERWEKSCEFATVPRFVSFSTPLLECLDFSCFSLSLNGFVSANSEAPGYWEHHGLWFQLRVARKSRIKRRTKMPWACTAWHGYCISFNLQLAAEFEHILRFFFVQSFLRMAEIMFDGRGWMTLVAISDQRWLSNSESWPCNPEPAMDSVRACWASCFGRLQGWCRCRCIDGRSIYILKLQRSNRSNGSLMATGTFVKTIWGFHQMFNASTP